MVAGGQPATILGDPPKHPQIRPPNTPPKIPLNIAKSPMKWPIFLATFGGGFGGTPGVAQNHHGQPPPRMTTPNYHWVTMMTLSIGCVGVPVGVGVCDTSGCYVPSDIMSTRMHTRYHWCIPGYHTGTSTHYHQTHGVAIPTTPGGVVTK